MRLEAEQPGSRASGKKRPTAGPSRPKPAEPEQPGRGGGRAHQVERGVVVAVDEGRHLES